MKQKIDKRPNRSKSSLGQFYSAFAQAKNVIDKQIKVGNRIKTRNQNHKLLSNKIKEMKTYKPMQTQPIAIRTLDNDELDYSHMGYNTSRLGKPITNNQILKT